MSDTSGLYTGCPVQYTRQFLAGKWQMGILWNLRNQSLRFGEIKKLLPGISDKTLMKELDFFVQKKIIERKIVDFPLYKTEYLLSSAGLSLVPVITSIIEWGYLHLQDEQVHKEMSMTPMPIIQEIESSLPGLK